MELSNIGGRVSESKIVQKIAAKFRKDKEEKDYRETRAIRKRLFVSGFVITALLAAGFLVGWFASLFHHIPPRETYESGYDRDGQTSENIFVETGMDCQVEGEKTRGHTCAHFYLCIHGKIVEEPCPNFHHFDSKSSSCKWIHLADCQEGQDVSDVLPQTPVDNDIGPVEDVLPPVEDVLPPVEDVLPPGTLPTLQQVLDTEVRLVKKHGVMRARRYLRTAPQEEVEMIQPGRRKNPDNVKLLESIIKEKDWEFIFPVRNLNYTYRGFLQAASKFPAFCATREVCALSLAVIFSHFAQETGAHDRSKGIPEWRQGLFYLEEEGCSNRDCGYSANCRQSDWLTETWPCQKDENGRLQSYHGRGAKQLTYNYNYGQFSTLMYGEPVPLLQSPGLVSTTWFNLASAIWFFLAPQPPKPSMLEVIDGSWVPNEDDEKNGLSPGFGVTTHIINGGVECGKGTELPQERNRQEYFRQFSGLLGVSWTNATGCSDMKEFPAKGAGAQDLYWEQDWSRQYFCKLVSYHTAFNSLVPGDYLKCVEKKFSVKIL